MRFPAVRRGTDERQWPQDEGDADRADCKRPTTTPVALQCDGRSSDSIQAARYSCVHDLKWTTHVDAIVANAASRLHFFKQLKRAGASIRDLLHFYKAIVCPVLEYACSVWHSGLTVAQSDEIESVQKLSLIHI